MVPGMFEEADEYTDDDRPSSPSDVESNDVFVEPDRSTKGKGKERTTTRLEKAKKGKTVEKKRKRAVEDEQEEQEVQEEVPRILRSRRSKAILRSSLVTPPSEEEGEEWEPDFETSGDEHEEHAGPLTRAAKRSRMERSKKRGRK
ncbi:hypothetical protein TREMEDRAFT_62474 [Tremella mesenterica DSM 1558]|uniref:uncharacterized protein n=1 Tax=Tremella mesenterica (strain ATCC 24925 / CBS 8224 / DSM 1558 / NBRC 9311 / NRRL Y-6157 / RJB 2259-6 / UBC 559-6) TaxID=578456 RepID=UPI0003F49E50|nr:uncharacterized protein TREMEDRAFT_62474 [Tremella mesenterica DSM 1558]EIW69606.1 hypothetical protein TREMEDRAFT_62474 [Tremella mesenterica DSM 1558]